MLTMQQPPAPTSNVAQLQGLLNQLATKGQQQSEEKAPSANPLGSKSSHKSNPHTLSEDASARARDLPTFELKERKER